MVVVRPIDPNDSGLTSVLQSGGPPAPGAGRCFSAINTLRLLGR